MIVRENEMEKHPLALLKNGIKLCVRISLLISLVICATACKPDASIEIPTEAATTVPQPTIVLTATQPPRDIPIYRNSFGNISDLAATGITSNVDISTNTDNFNYPGDGIALEISGMLGASQYDSVFVDISIPMLTGESRLDLSDKTIYYSAFIPEGSAIDNISILAGSGPTFVSLAGVNTDDWWKKGVWHDYLFDFSSMDDIPQNCDTLRIAGIRLSSGQAEQVSFLVDDLMWIRSDRFNPPVDRAADSLRKYAEGRHFKIGFYPAPYIVFPTEDNPVWQGDPWYAYEVSQEGTMNVVENFTPNPNFDYANFDYDPATDSVLLRQYKFGESNALTTLGYGIGTLYYHPPQWLMDLQYPDEIGEYLLYETEKELGQTKGETPIWLLFNEFLLGVSQGGGLKNRTLPGEGGVWQYSPWASSKTDASLIISAIQKAAETDPDAILLLNEYENEQIGYPRSEMVYRFFKDLVRKEVPIDGVGFQLHNQIEPDGTIKLMVPNTWPIEWEYVDMATFMGNVDANVKRYNDLGMKVAFTEIEGYIRVDDIDLSTAEGRQAYEARLLWQAKYYKGLMQIALDNPNVILYNMWGVSDRYDGATTTSEPEWDDPYIFDKNYNPKPAYFAILTLLKEE